jgi:hypothetical protein
MSYTAMESLVEGVTAKFLNEHLSFSWLCLAHAFLFSKANAKIQ